MSRARWPAWGAILVGIAILVGTLMAFLSAWDAVLQGAWVR